MKTAPPPHVELELRDVPASDAGETIRRGRRLISSKVGLIRKIAETRWQAQDPAVFAAGVLPADVARYPSDGLPLKAGGAGDDAVTALASAIGEAAERYCAYFYDRDAMVVGSYRELAEDAVSPDLLRLFSRQQIASFGAHGPDYFDDGSRISWMWGYSLSERRPRLVPASLVYLNYRPEEGEAKIGFNASTGLAAGGTREEAILGGLLEIIERDAFTLAWQHRQIGRRIEVDDDGVQRELRTRLWADRPSVDVKIFDITTDVGVPVTFLVMRRQCEFGPVACVGTAARVSPRQALRKSMLEAAQAFPYFRYLMDSEKDWQPAADFSNLTTFDYHFLTYLKRPDLIPPAFAFCDACEERVALSAIADRSSGRVLADLEHCLACLRDAGYEVIVTDITTPDIAEVGFVAVRVMVPGLVPLHGDHRTPFLGARRLFEAPSRLGWERRGWRRDGGLNPFPHPFP
ncbi:MAG: YcaO-like family protein [Thermoanaerobaculia bacterium]